MFMTAAWSVGLVLMMGCAQADTQATSDDPTSPGIVLFNITSGPDDPHAVTMALQLAGHTLDAGRDAVLFFNVRGVEVPITTLPDDLAFGDRPIKELLQSLMDRGAQVHVCPHCMQALQVEESALMPGAQVTNRELLFANITSNTVVFTY
jgi:predicted peroxiredoxin